MNLPAIESVECFLAAARFLNFRAAAHAVFLTPAALGKRIRQLETTLGTRLFQRTTRKVELTDAGLAFLPHARELVRAAEACVRAARGETGPPPLALTLGTRHELGLSWVVPLLDRIQERHPHLTVHLYFSSGPDLEARVRHGDIECAVTSRAVSDPKIAGERLHQEGYIFVAHPKLLKARRLARPEDALGHTLIDAHAELPLFRYFRQAPGGLDLRFGKVLLVGTIAAMRQLVLARKGVAVLPDYLVNADLEAKRLVRVFPEVELPSDWFRLIYRDDDPHRAVYLALARTMAEVPLPGAKARQGSKSAPSSPSSPSSPRTPRSF